MECDALKFADGNPFAVGDGLRDFEIKGVVTRMRVSTKPLDGRGMPIDSVTVRWEVAT